MRFDKLSSTNQRLIGAVILVPVACGFALSPPIAALMLGVLAFLMGWELGTMAGHSGARRLALSVLLLGATIPFSWTHVASPLDINTASIIAAFCVLVATILAFQNAARLTAILGFFLGLCVVTASGMFATDKGHLLVLILAIAIAACDIAAYFIGRSVGGPKLAPKISPKKTWSGSVAGVAAAVIVMVWFSHFFAPTPMDGAFIGVFVGILAQAGDLLESAVKRALNVKDSGSTIPGHGGVLDRFDGYLISVPAAYFYTLLAAIS